MRAATLTRREAEIAELFAWGASKKEVADRLFISERTVENHARNIYEKTGCSKVNELAAWWFCKRFNISFDLSPLKRRIVSICLLAIVIPQVTRMDNAILRVRNVASRATRVCRRKAEEGATIDLTLFGL